MTLIIHSPTEDKDFVKWSTGEAIRSLSNTLNANLCQIDAQEWGYALSSGRWTQAERNNVDLIIAEATYLEINGLNDSNLRSCYPNARIVVLSSDAIYFAATGKNGGFQFPGVARVDLFLELDPRVREHYIDLGCTNIDEWKWTASGGLLDRIAQTPNKPFEEREFDFIGVYAPHTIAREGSYRNQMVNAIQSAGLKFTQGGGSGHGDSDIDRLISHYKNSKFTLGTSSHDNPLLTQCVKGFRDFVGPACGATLIYDDNPAIRTYGVDIPNYKYGNFDELIYLTEKLSEDQTTYLSYLKHQQDWTRQNTIEKQLFRKLKEHKIV